MQPEYVNNILFLVGKKENFGKRELFDCRRPFDYEVIEFLDDLSKGLMSSQEAKRYSDIITFAFWCRKSSILAMKRKYVDLEKRKGRGLTFHITPSNIPVMFAFSLVASMLAGNSNVIRVSSKEFKQTGIICKQINELFINKYPKLGEENYIISYLHNQEVTDELSKMCDSRVIWGGNNSINSIRKSALKPSAIEIPFYDRFSMAIIGVKEYLSYQKKSDLAERFYIDTYFSDQNACSSPQLIFWYGGNEKELKRARSEFWQELKNIVDNKYSFQEIQGVDKIAAASKFLIEHDNAKVSYEDLRLVTVFLTQLDENLKKYRCPGGYFYEYHSDKLNEIKMICDVECQTIAYYGVEREKIVEIISTCRGGDRIVPIGDTMNFGLVWDGFDFINSLSKIIG